MKKIILSVLYVVLIFFSCTHQQSEESMKLIDFSNPQLVEDDIQDWIQIKKSIQLKLPDSIMIGKIVQMEFSDSELFLLESGSNSSILVFD